MKLVYGFGVNDVVNSSKTREYGIWKAIIERCYSGKPLIKHSTYMDCIIDEEFKLFSGFNDWFKKQIGSNQKGWEIDKDVLINGNKEYHPDKCVFLPREINGFLKKRKKCRGEFPIGVTLNKHGSFVAMMSLGSEREYLGSFQNPNEAFEAYKIAKEAHIKVLANKYKDMIDPRAYEALMRYEVKITD